MDDDDEPPAPVHEPRSGCAAVFGSLSEAKEFNLAIFLAIVIAAVSVGLQTNPDWSSSPVLKGISATVLWVFVLEAVVKLLALWPNLHRYYFDGWNLFDVSIVLIGLVQFFGGSDSGATVVVVRLFRVLRILKMLKQAPQLRVVVGTMFAALPCMLYLFMLVLLLFYIYGVIGVLLFQTNDPRYFSSLGQAYLTLFRVMTADQWSEIMYVNMKGCTHEYSPANQHYCKDPQSFGALAGLYFVSFIVLAGLVLINLMIASVTCTMDAVAVDVANQHKQDPSEDGTADQSPDKSAPNPEQSRAADRHKEVIQILRELEDKIELQTRDIMTLQTELNETS